MILEIIDGDRGQRRVPRQHLHCDFELELQKLMSESSCSSAVYKSKSLPYADACLCMASGAQSIKPIRMMLAHASGCLLMASGAQRLSLVLARARDLKCVLRIVLFL